MQSNQIARNILKTMFSESHLAFFDNLDVEEQEFIEYILLTTPQALEVDIAFPKITILISQLELNITDTNILNSINNLSNTNLQICICLDEIIMDKKKPGFADHLPQFDIKKYRHEEDLQFRLAICQWRYQQRPTLLAILSSKLGQCSPWEEFSYVKLLENLNFIYEQNKDEVYEVIKLLVPYLSYLGELEKAAKGIKSPAIQNLFRKAIVALEPAQGFVLRAINNSNVEEVEFLLGMIADPDIKQVDLLGNTPLHLVHTLRLLPVAFAITSDIDQVNCDGNTALHTAMITSDEQKVNFLLLKGARTDIKNAKGETCWTIPSIAPNKALELYRLYVLTGHAISYFAKPANQVGLCCGLYASAYLINYHNLLYPEIVTQDAIARKCDANNSKEKMSLRKKAKQKGFTKVGEILSLDSLAVLINEANSPTEIATIENYTHFISVLQKASMRKQMVIIPFCYVENDPYDGNTPLDATKAHLATFIGLRMDANGNYFCLLAHHGGYQEINAKGLFYAFFNIPEKMPTLYFYKNNNDWHESRQPNWNNLSLPCRKIYATDLGLFRRRLLIGVTPHEQKPKSSSTHITGKQTVKNDPGQAAQPKKRYKML